MSDWEEKWKIFNVTFWGPHDSIIKWDVSNFTIEQMWEMRRNNEWVRILISSLLMQQHSGPLGLSNHWEWFSLWIFSLGSWKKLSSTTAQTSQDIDYILSA